MNSNKGRDAIQTAFTSVDGNSDRRAVSFADLSDEDKLRVIDISSELGQVPMGCRPPVGDIDSDYYFVSYSHKDYKKVYRDIFKLCGRCSFWYDREMVYGTSWLDTAEKYIRNSHCRGVIFYISENSMLSDSIHKEINYAVESGKNWCTFNLPIEHSYIYNGKDYNGVEVSAKQMLDILIAAGISVDQEKYDFISRTLGQSVLYAGYSAPYDVKFKAITTIERTRPFEFRKTVICNWIITAITDIFVHKLIPEDFVGYDQNNACIYLEGIGDCVFANLKNLEEAILPQSVRRLGSHVFYRCKVLKRVVLGPKLEYVGESVFQGCEMLADVNLQDTILSELAEEALRGCCSLKEIRLPTSMRKIGAWAFAKCAALESVTLPVGIEQICEHAFHKCEKLEEIFYGGTKEQWSAVRKCEDWDGGIRGYSVICADGVI